MSDQDGYPINPDYGNGCYHRHIQLSAETGLARGELEDDNHGFCVTVEHDGHQVTALHPETRRAPFTSCDGAVEPLQALIGLPLSDDAAKLIELTRPTANCTHLFDLTILTISQAARFLKNGENRRRYEIRLSDQQPERDADCEIRRNGELVHHWQTRDWVITGPAELAGKVLFKGFRHWASEAFAGDEAEAAFALQKGYFVGNARQYNLKSLDGEAAIAHKDYMYGVCYTYTSPQIERATRIASAVRDFSDTPEQLLQFID